MITLGTQGKNTFLEAVNVKSGANVLECYQCGKCVSTCPVSQYMDFPPREIMQMIKLGLRNECYMANSHWFCLTCSACSGRCPREIDIPAVMEAVRHLAIEENHINDSKKGLGSRVDRHDSLGKGTLGLEVFKRLMHDPRFDDIPLILETPDETIWKDEIKLLYSLENSQNFFRQFPLALAVSL